MNKCKKIISLIFIIFIISSTHYSCFATQQIKIAKGNDVIDTKITSNSFIRDLSPDGLNGTAEQISTPFVSFIHQIVNPILGVVQIIGGVLTVISIAIFGFNMLLGGNSELANDIALGHGIGMHGEKGGPKEGPGAKKEMLDFGRSLLIGAVLLFCSATIVKFVFSIFM